eukprot:scaffold4012_cov127-Skeletonema_menzelii.AAC.5
MKKKKSGRGKAKKMLASSSKQKKEQHGSLDTQMEQLKIAAGDNSHADANDEAALLEEAIKLAAAEKEALESRYFSPSQCHHGYVPGEYHFIIEGFSETFLSGFESLHGEDCPLEGFYLEGFYAAYKATYDKYPELWTDSSKLKLVVSLFLCQGTEHVLRLRGNLRSARFFAFLACHLEDYMALCMEGKGIVACDTAKLYELLHTDEHTLVKYLRKNIPCSCLDEKYKEVKAVTKMGFCWNETCSLPNRMAKRSTMLCCDRCRKVNYCSRECQKAAWPGHKQKCGNVHTLIAELESRKREIANS